MLADSRTITRLRAGQAEATARTAPPLSHRRIRALDGFRGFALVLVVNFHFMDRGLHGAGLLPRPNTVWLDTMTLKVAGIGWSGLDLFFVLSGFLITGILYDSRDGNGYFRIFYARRFLRVVPAYYTFLILLLVVFPLLQPMEHVAAADLRANQLWYWSYTSNLRPAFHPALSGDFLLVGHIWSLAVEEQFYFIWPLIVLLVPRRQLLWMCAGAIVVAPCVRLWLDASGATPLLAHYLTPARMDALAVGSAVALVVRDPTAFARLARFAAPVAATAIGVLLALFITRDGVSYLDPWVQTIGFSAAAALWGATLVAILNAPAQSRLSGFFCFGVLQWCGRYSYAIYLVHVPIAVLLARRIDIPASVFTIAGSRLPGALLFELLVAALSVAMGWLSWNLLESRFLKLKSRFEYASAGEPAGR